MRLNYTILDALAHLKKEIADLEARLKQEKSRYTKRLLQNRIQWNFERGIEIIKLAKPDEITQEDIDFFLGRRKERPDFEKLERLMRAE